MTLFIQVEDLANNLEQYVVFDTRFDLFDITSGRKKYEESHIPSAIYLDLEADLSGAKKTHGGNHPLPETEVFIGKLNAIGVTKDTPIVIYDDGNTLFASRLYFLLDYYLYTHVYLLEGGFTAWEKRGFTTESGVNPIGNIRPLDVPAHVFSNLVVDIDDVMKQKDQPGVVLTDARSEARFLGKEEPLYHKRGHIPGARCFDWTNVLDQTGTFKTKEALERVFASLKKEEEIILSCGSGVSACVNYVALKSLGYPHIKLYPGSFSDWISYDRLPLATDLTK